MNPRRLLKFFVFVALFVGAAGLAAEEVRYAGADGFELVADFWQTDAGAPGILLLHQCDATRTMYSSLGSRLAAAGYRVLAPDLRGLGDSTGEGFDLGSAGTPEDWKRAEEAWPGDVSAAHAFLAEKGSGPIVAALGASCGGRQVVTLAGQQPDLTHIGLLSARLDAYAQRDVYQLQGKKILVVYGEGDMGASRPAGMIMYRKRADAIPLAGDGHGAALFATYPDLEGRIADWFVNALAD